MAVEGFEFATAGRQELCALRKESWVLRNFEQSAELTGSVVLNSSKIYSKIEIQYSSNYERSQLLKNYCSIQIISDSIEEGTVNLLSTMQVISTNSIF